MKRELTGRLVVATHNMGKVKEFERLMALPGLVLVSAVALNLPEPEETGSSFADNARLKAHAAARASGLPAMADDSGLCITELNGAPGIFSARAAGPDKNFARAVAGFFEEAGDPPFLHAAFVCALALAFPDGACDIFEGRAEGLLYKNAHGENGFGYDPFFVPSSDTRRYAAMTAEEKEKTSHRARAAAALKAAYGA